MTRHQKAAARYVAAKLAAYKEPVMLYTVSCWADEGARNAGRKTELFGSLYDYEDLLPAGWRLQWLASSKNPGGDRILYCTPPGWQSGDSDSQQLLLGGGMLVTARQTLNQWSDLD